MVSFFHQLRILSEKQARVKLRLWKTSLSELLFPVMLLLMFNAPNIFTDRPTAPATAVINWLPVPPELSNNASFAQAVVTDVVGFLAPPLFPPTPPYDAVRPPLFWAGGAPPILAIAPRSSTRASLLYSMLHGGFLKEAGFAASVQLFDSDAAIEAAYADHPNTMWAGIVVNDDDGSGSDDFSYTLRLNGTYAPSSASGAAQMVQPIGVRVGALRGDYAYYESTGFFALQQLVDLAMDTASSAAPTPKARQIREMPSVPRDVVNTPYALVWIIGWCMNIANTFFVSSALAAVVFEKEHAIWQGLATLGVSPAAWWAHWLATLLSTAVPVAALDTGVMFLVGNCYFSNPFLIFLFVLLYFVALVAVVTALVPLLPKSDKAVTLSTGVAFILSILYLPLVVYGVDNHYKRWLAFLPWHAFFYGVEIMRFLEDLKVGVTWTTLFGGGSDFGVSFGALLLIMLVAPLLWLAVAAYLSRVMPAFGAPRGACFCVAEPIGALCGAGRRCATAARRAASGARQRVSTLNAALLPEGESGVGSGGERDGAGDSAFGALQYDGVDHEVPNATAGVGVQVRASFYSFVTLYSFVYSLYSCLLIILLFAHSILAGAGPRQDVPLEGRPAATKRGASRSRAVARFNARRNFLAPRPQRRREDDDD